jgi:hypothetical protein
MVLVPGTSKEETLCMHLYCFCAINIAQTESAQNSQHGLLVPHEVKTQGQLLDFATYMIYIMHLIVIVTLLGIAVSREKLNQTYISLT